MTKIKIRLLALLLAAALLLSGCDLAAAARRIAELREEYSTEETQTPDGPLFSEMEYIRPDMEQLEAVLAAACESAGSDDLDTVLEGVYAFNEEFDWFYTYYCIADIHYSQDLTDPYWEEEYHYCVESSARVDAALEELYYSLAGSPCREELESEDYFGEGYFDSYDGENNWDEEFTALLQREAELENRYYELTSEAGDLPAGTGAYYDRYAPDMAQILVELIRVRKAQAAYWGYDSYADFAWDFYYYRDYTPGEIRGYMEDVARELVPVYEAMAETDVWTYSARRSTESQTMDYVRQAAKSMGGSVWDAFSILESRQLYDIAYGPNKYPTSFEVYLTCYEVPFVFVCPAGENYDKLTFAHEFGHFCNDYHSYGSSAGVDVLEVFSQGMEYLSLCYGEDTEKLTRVKLADSLSTYVEQSAFASFELALYELPEEELDVEGLCGVYDRVARQYGFESVGYDPREFVTISHFYTQPMYIPSYVVSNDAAMQLYQLEQEDAGAGLARYEEHLDTQELWFLSFLDSAGLESPFAEGRIQRIAQLFRQKLLP